MPKVLVGIVTTIVLVVLGFLLGIVVGQPRVSTADGLAAGAIVLGYGVGGAAIALVVGVALSIKLNTKTVAVAGGLALIGCVCVFGYLRYKKVQKDKTRALIEAQEEKDSFRNFRLGVSLYDDQIKPANLSGVENISTAIRGRKLTFPAETSGKLCDIDLVPDESKMLLGNLNSVIESAQDSECTIDDENPKAAFFVWHFYDNELPERGNWTLSRTCYDASPQARNMVSHISDLASSKCVDED